MTMITNVIYYDVRMTWKEPHSGNGAAHTVPKLEGGDLLADIYGLMLIDGVDPRTIHVTAANIIIDVRDLINWALEEYGGHLDLMFGIEWLSGSGMKNSTVYSGFHAVMKFADSLQKSRGVSDIRITVKATAKEKKMKIPETKVLYEVYHRRMDTPVKHSTSMLLSEEKHSTSMLLSEARREAKRINQSDYIVKIFRVETVYTEEELTGGKKITDLPSTGYRIANIRPVIGQWSAISWEFACTDTTEFRPGLVNSEGVMVVGNENLLEVTDFEEEDV